MDRYGEMQAFLHVVDHGGFSEAAKPLGLSPSAVSKLISRLEDRLGARLLQRTTRRVSLTAEGRVYADQVREILADIDAVEASVGGAEAEPRGLLRINVAHGFGMSQIVPAIPDFIARHPKVDVKLTFTDHIVDLIAEGDDVGIRLNDVRDETLITRRLATYTRMICGAPRYFERYGLPQTPTDLLRHRAIHSNDVNVLNQWSMRWPDGREERIAVPGHIYSNSGDALFRLCSEGLGLAYLADSLAFSEIAEGRLIPVLNEFVSHNTWPIYAVYPARKHLAARVRAFVDFLAERFSPTPPWVMAPAR